jgi:YHS domain-containing protein
MLVARMSACPTCGKPIDPLRAPVATVRSGRVVGYCSEACKVGGSRAPTSTAEFLEDRKRRDSLASKQAWDWIDDEPAAPPGMSIGGRTIPRLVVIAFALAGVAGIGFAIYRLA